MAILSIQSHVVLGHAGNSAAVFPLERLGFEVWPLHTAILSSHKGHDGWRGFEVRAEQLGEILAGLEASGAWARCEAVLAGYLADAAQAECVARTVAAVRRANPSALFCLDPVMGERDGGLYVPEAAARAVRDRLVPLADLALPNGFELEFLAGRAVDSLESALDAAERVRARGPRLVICTSWRKTEGRAIETLAVDGEGAWRIATPLLPERLSGTGDVFAALFLAHRLKGASTPEALEGAVASIYGLMKRRFEEDPEADELALARHQGEIVKPSERFAAEPVR